MNTKSNAGRSDRLIARLTPLFDDDHERALLAGMIQALDRNHGLGGKIKDEPEVEGIVAQMVERLSDAVVELSSLRGMRILDIACGSNTSRAPISKFFGRSSVDLESRGFAACFEPWFCRMLHELGAVPVGVDLGDLDRESFTHYRVDLGAIGSLDFLPGHSFDAVQDSRLFGSPEFTTRFKDYSTHILIAREICRQEQRLLKPGGIIIHSDAQDLAG